MFVGQHSSLLPAGGIKPSPSVFAVYAGITKKQQVGPMAIKKGSGLNAGLVPMSVLIHTKAVIGSLTKSPYFH